MAYTDPLERAILPKLTQLRINSAKNLKLIIEDKKTYAESDGRDAIIKILQAVLNGRYNDNIEVLQKDIIEMYKYADMEYDLQSDFNTARNFIQFMQSPTRCLMRELIRRMGLYHYSDIKDRNLKMSLTRLINKTKNILMSCETTKEGIDAMLRLIDNFKKIQDSIDPKDSYHIYYKSIIDHMISVSKSGLFIIGYDETTYAPQQTINESIQSNSYNENSIILTDENYMMAIYSLGTEYLKKVHEALNDLKFFIQYDRNGHKNENNPINYKFGQFEYTHIGQKDIVGYENVSRDGTPYNPIYGNDLYRMQWKMLEGPMSEYKQFYERMVKKATKDWMKQDLLNKARGIEMRMARMRDLANGIEPTNAQFGKWANQYNVNESVSRPSNGSMPYDEYMDSQRGPMVPAAKEKIVQDRLIKYFNKFLELKNGYLRNYDVERVSRWYGADATNQALPIVKKELQPVYDIVTSTKFIREMRLLSGGDGMYLANHYNDIFVDMQEKAGQVEDKFRKLKDIWEERQSNAMNENDTNLYNLYGAVYNLISRKYEDTSKLFESVYEYCSTALNLLNIKLG